MAILVEFFLATGCPFAEKAVNLIDQISTEFGDRILVKKYDLTASREDLLYARNKDIFMAPTIAIAGEVIFEAKLPTKEALVQVIEEVERFGQLDR